jgi:predicted HAD superfamily Cof-like phosphohydrolase
MAAVYSIVDGAKLRDDIYERLAKIADDLGDIDYVVEGTRLEFGIDGASVAAEIHRANMSKRWDDGRFHSENGKVVKSPFWTPPDIDAVLLRQGWNPKAA